MMMRRVLVVAALGWIGQYLVGRPAPQRPRPTDRVRFTVVIPVRDEQHRIGRLLTALDAMSRAEVPVIVVDDGSTDATAAIATAAGATVLVGSEPPAGWAGKTWAIAQAMDQVTTDVVICLDADVEPTPSALHWLAAQVTPHESGGADLISVAPRFDLDPTSRWLHAAMLAGLVYRTGRPGVARRAERAFVNGQIIAARPRDLSRWLPVVCGALVEDIALARHVAAEGGRVEFVDGSDRFLVRPYATPGDTWRGWGRSIGGRGVEPWWRQVVDHAAIGVLMIAPWWRGPLGVMALGLRVGVLAGTATSYERRGWTFWLSPLADPLAWAASVWGLVNPTPRWRGRQWRNGTR